MIRRRRVWYLIDVFKYPCDNIGRNRWFLIGRRAIISFRLKRISGMREMVEVKKNKLEKGNEQEK